MCTYNKQVYLLFLPKKSFPSPKQDQTCKKVTKHNICLSPINFLFTNISRRLHKKKEPENQAPFKIYEISILSDNKFLCSHAFGGVDFDEINT